MLLSYKMEGEANKRLNIQFLLPDGFLIHIYQGKSDGSKTTKPCKFSDAFNARLVLLVRSHITGRTNNPVKLFKLKST